MKVRTRIAPSPTGIPHTGTIRTALFDYLLAKKYGGEFVLRIEDTDQKRLVPESLEAIFEIFDFLQISPDEGPRSGGNYGPYIQTERLDIYQKYVKQLLDKGVAYEDEGAIRIRMPKEGYSTWHDMVQGKISIPNKEMDDKVLMKSDGIPTYHLAVVVDDHLMEITHIIRGVEWISSTPVHLKLYEALGWEVPVIAHVPLLLGPDKSKLSKRHGAKSVLQYRDEGYLPEAINNFLFYLGNSYQDNSAILTLSQMVQVFDEKKLQKQNAVFDIKKLDYFNGLWIRKLDEQDFLKRVRPLIDYQISDELLMKIIPLTKERISTLKEFAPLIRFFVERPSLSPELSGKESFIKEAMPVLETTQWTKEDIESLLQQLCQEKDFHRGDFFMALRLAVCGQRVTPPLTESMIILGRDEVIARLNQVIE